MLCYVYSALPRSFVRCSQLSVCFSALLLFTLCDAVGFAVDVAVDVAVNVCCWLFAILLLGHMSSDGGDVSRLLLLLDFTLPLRFTRYVTLNVTLLYALVKRFLSLFCVCVLLISLLFWFPTHFYCSRSSRLVSSFLYLLSFSLPYRSFVFII